MLIKTSISAALLLAAAPALAAPAPGNSSETVSYADLNLASPAGIAALDRRIDRAVRRVCGASHPADLNTGFQVRQCRVTAYRSIAARRSAALAAASTSSGGLAAGRTR